MLTRPIKLLQSCGFFSRLFIPANQEKVLKKSGETNNSKSETNLWRLQGDSQAFLHDQE